MIRLIKPTIVFLLMCLTTNLLAVEIYGHRGARGLAPENTIPAYKDALAIGVNYIDMDVVMTKDHHVVVSHDLTLNPNFTRDKNGKWIDPNKKILVKDLTLKELQFYDVGRIKPGTAYAKLFKHQIPVDGTHIPTLKQVIDYTKRVAGDKVGFQIEIKNDPDHPDETFPPTVLAKAVAKILQQENIVDRTEVQAFDWRNLYELHKINPKIKTAFLTYKAGINDMLSSNNKIAGLWTGDHLFKDYTSMPAMVFELGGNIWGPQDTELTKKNLDIAHKLGLKVVVWTWPGEPDGDHEVFNKQRMHQLIIWGVDGIITDRPDKLRALLKSMGKSIPEQF